jgi:hypothetical protein
MTTPEDVGRWLHETILENNARRSYQSTIVRRIRNELGEEFSYRNRNGNWAIDKTVLKEFNRIRDEHIVWDRSDQSWRVLDDDQLANYREREARKAAMRAEREERRPQFTKERE